MQIHLSGLVDTIQYEEFGINGREQIIHFWELYVTNKPEWQVISTMCWELNWYLFLGDAKGANQKLDFYIDQWKEQGIIADDKDIPIWIQHFISLIWKKINWLESYLKKFHEPKSEKLALQMGLRLEDAFSKN